MTTTTDTLLDAAIAVARHSPNRVRKVGAVLVPRGADTTRSIHACNTYPQGVQDTEERHLGNGRLVWMEHAERNAIFAAARAGLATEGATLASTYFPCTDCARAIVQAGIRHVHTLPPDESDPVWGVSFGPSRTILEEAGVEMHFSARDAASVHAATMAAGDDKADAGA
jgi:dCMP deaminase